MCCFTLRGAAFFGSSIHLCMGFIQMGRFLDFCIVLFTNPKITYTLEYCLAIFANLLYAGLRLPLSSLIFIGIEKNCIPLLTWTPIFHFLMQIFGFMLRIKYGLMVIQPRVGGKRSSGSSTIGWVKEEFAIPDSIEKFMEQTLFGFIFTTFHLLILFFLVQNIETSVQGQVLDPSPGYSVTFFPHPIQPPRWYSRFTSNNNNRTFCLQSPTSFFPPGRNEHVHTNTASSLSRTSDEMRPSSENLSSQTEEPPPYYYNEDRSNIPSTSSSCRQEQIQPVLNLHSTSYQQQHLETIQDNNDEDFSSITGQELMDARTPLLPLCEYALASS